MTSKCWSLNFFTEREKQKKTNINYLKCTTPEASAIAKGNTKGGHKSNKVNSTLEEEPVLERQSVHGLASLKGHWNINLSFEFVHLFVVMRFKLIISYINPNSDHERNHSKWALETYKNVFLEFKFLKYEKLKKIKCWSK